MALEDILKESVGGSKEVFELVKGQFSKWDKAVNNEILKLENWKNSYESAGIGLKKYKGVIGGRRDYRKAVVPLVELTDGADSRKSAFSYTAGRFELVRTNGCCIYSPVVIDIKAIKAYNTENMDLYKNHLDEEHVKPCKFILNGKLYGGLHIYFNVLSHHLLFNGWSNCNALGYYDYIDIRGEDGDGVTNEEIYNSLEIIEG